MLHDTQESISVFIIEISQFANINIYFPGVSFKELFGRVSRSLDQHLNNHVAGVLQEEEPTDTKTDLVLENAEEGAIALLRKWPDMRSKLHVCFNQPLPKELRQLAWKLFMENSKCNGIAGCAK